MSDKLIRSPIYQQLHDQLRQILSADYEVGQQFLTEREVSERFGVSRTTANKTISSLVSEGLLEFRKGIGTFVRPSAIGYDLQTLISFSQLAKSVGKAPTTKVLKFEEVLISSAPEEFVKQLTTGRDSTLWYMQRLRFADEVPVILESRYVVKSTCPTLSLEELTGALYDAWTNQHHLEIGGADICIRAVLPNSQEAARLGVVPGSPVFEIGSTGFLSSGQPMWWERTLYRGDCYEFHSHLASIPQSTPARGALRQG